jgi:uncharacterized membrane protein
MEVKAKDGVLRIEAQIEGPGTLHEVWQLLTDYERLPEYMPNVDSSRVVSRTDSSLWVRQVLTTQLIMPWTFIFTLEYVAVAPDQLRFRHVEGQLKSYEGCWRLTPRGERTEISYQARVTYRLVPGFLAAYIVRRQLGQMMPALVVELQRRTGRQ